MEFNPAAVSALLEIQEKENGLFLCAFKLVENYNDLLDCLSGANFPRIKDFKQGLITEKANIKAFIEEVNHLKLEINDASKYIEKIMKGKKDGK